MGPYRSPALEDEAVRAKEYDHQAGVIRSPFLELELYGIHPRESTKKPVHGVVGVCLPSVWVNRGQG